MFPNLDSLDLRKMTSFLIDFDGVILDTCPLLSNYSNREKSKLPWKDILCFSKEINRSVDILLHLQYYIENMFIISKVFSLREANNKLSFLRDNSIFIPFIPVPNGVRKDQMFVPNSTSVLVDDNYHDVASWQKAGGTGIHFTQELGLFDDCYQTYSLDFLYRFL